MEDEQLLRHLSLVVEANKKTNITRITSFEEAKVLHIEDSLAALPEIREAKAGRYGDLGSGAGYPGIPIALATGRETVLTDSVGKKTALLDSFIEELGLAGTVSTYTGRIEDLAAEEPESFSVLTARALSKTASLLELASPLLPIGGRLVCYKARMEEGELSLAVSLAEKTGMHLVSDRELLLSDGETYRRILVFEKKAKPKVKLPRRVGLAQKKPLKP